MKTPERRDPDSALRETAARWTVRRDRGLSAAESIEFELWLAADERHAVAMQRAAGAWSRLDRMPDEIARQTLQAATRRRSFWRRSVVAGSLAAAAAVAVALLNWPASEKRPALPVAVASSADNAPRSLTLTDGTVVHLNTNSSVVEQFTAGERRVLLARGEAHFSVTKNPARPFVVRAGSLEVRAVGTAFNVNLQSAAVEVLVTQGVVQLTSAVRTAPSEPTPVPIPPLNAGQRAVVALQTASPDVAVVVSAVSPAEIARTLAWQEPLLRFGGATLAEVAASFEQRTGQRMILADPSLAALRLGGRFRADDIDGFAHVLAATLEIEVERAADGALVLRKKIQVRDSGK
jgi:transmembrane sensor